MAESELRFNEERIDRPFIVIDAALGQMLAAMAVLRKQPKTEIVGIEQDPTQANRAIPIRA